MKSAAMNIEEIYHGTKPLVMNNCEFPHHIDQIIYSEKIKEKVKEATTPATTNIIVTKYADSTSDILDVDSTLDLGNKGKIIEVELLPSGIKDKNNFESVINRSVLKKNARRKAENSEGKKFSQNSVRKKKMKQSINIAKEFITKESELVSEEDFDNKSSQDIMCNECNKQFFSKILLKKHLVNCKPQSLGAALCSKCGKHFSSNYNLKRHMTSCKLCPDNEKSPRFMCQCGRTYSQEWDMKKHKLKCKDGKKKCKRCLMSNCNLLFYHKAQLVAHMKKDHNMIIQDPKVLNFNSFDEFLLWKEKEEEETFTYYSKQTGSNVSGVSVNTYYVCQHDGSDRTHNAAPRKTDRRNKKGRIKTGRLCWSQMNVKEFKDGTVKVTYFPSHTHPVSIADTEHHPLPSSVSMEIKRRFSEMSKLSENDEFQADENQDLKKGRRKRYSMSLRTLRALARKNRSLFRITAEAMQKPGEQGDSFEAKSNLQFPPSKNLSTNKNNIMQIFVTNQEMENGEDSNAASVFNISSSNITVNNNEKLLEDCINYLNDVRTHLLSGKLAQSVVLQIKESLKNICNIFKDESQEAVRAENQNPSECQEVMMFQPQAPLPVGEILPIQDEVNPSVELNEELKRLEAVPEKAVYQIIAVDGEEKTSNEFLYQNTVEMVGTREFIIITGDHAQLFQSVDSNIQFDLN